MPTAMSLGIMMWLPLPPCPLTQRPPTSKCTPRASAALTAAGLRRKGRRRERSRAIKSQSRAAQASWNMRSLLGCTATRS
jgi:hypothetical protein